MKTKANFTSFDQILDETFGAKGTQSRADYDSNVELWMVGQKIKEIRESKGLTQEDLGKLVGVQKAQISKIENGNNLTISTINKVFKALNLEAKLSIEDIELSLGKRISTLNKRVINNEVKVETKPMIIVVTEVGASLSAQNEYSFTNAGSLMSTVSADKEMYN